MAQVNCKIKTYSFMKSTLDKLDELCILKHNPNKSNILAQLVDAEHRRMVSEEEE